ncbi:LOW QUALITY PROTEIN: ammonium transporter Rh type B-like [Centruroides vittatus]|uniref:LOW QUALITY PROTEIN: ammonium transporter Rh type B-like n=1 Tax=Centruroides vittatus TaxID=120091 RepID=UPI00350F72F8
MTFLKKYAFNGVGFNLLLCSLTIQWSFIMQNIWKMQSGVMHFGIVSMVEANIASLAVLVSTGAVLGRINPLQLIIMSLIETVLYSLNKELGFNTFKVTDAGNSIFVHVFGAYFGLAVSFSLYQSEFSKINSGKSNLFSLIGTLFLWAFWPSYNSSGILGNDSHRAIVNTYLALVSCTLTTFGLSSLLEGQNRFNIIHIQNASIAGGVAIGTVANMMIQPYGAMLVGLAASILSVFGYAFLKPLLARKLKIQDTCGVHNLHGLPGVMGGILGVILTLKAKESHYGFGIYELFPALAPLENSTDLYEIHADYVPIDAGKNRSTSQQAVYQLVALVSTLAISIIGGLLTGVLLKLRIWDPSEHEYSCDVNFWKLNEYPKQRQSFNIE